MINIIYTAHAKQRMALRGITDEMVRQAVEQPDATDTGYEARSLAYRRFSEGRVKVVYVEEAGEIVLITAMWED